MTHEERLSNNEKAISDLIELSTKILNIVMRLEKIILVQEVTLEDIESRLTELENKPRRKTN